MQFIKESWKKEDYDEFEYYLLTMSKDSLKNFNDKIYNDNEKIGIGISLGTLRNIAKDILKGNSRSFLMQSKERFKYIEEVMIEGFVIAGEKISIEERLNDIDIFVPKISNWAICDSFVSSLKFVRENKEKYLKYIEKYHNSDKEFYLRFYIISLLYYYLEDDTIDYVIETLTKINSEHYYVKMAVSWTLAEAYVCYKDKVQQVIKSGSLDKFTHNKLISKICDSYRVEKYDKDRLKIYRK